MIVSRKKRQQEFEQSRALISVGRQDLVPVVSKDVQVLLEPDLSDERKVDIVLNFATYNPASTHTFPSKLNMVRIALFSITT